MVSRNTILGHLRLHARARRTFVGKSQHQLNLRGQKHAPSLNRVCTFEDGQKQAS